MDVELDVLLRNTSFSFSFGCALSVYICNMRTCLSSYRGPKEIGVHELIRGPGFFSKPFGSAEWSNSRVNKRPGQELVRRPRKLVKNGIFLTRRELTLARATN